MHSTYAGKDDRAAASSQLDSAMNAVRWRAGAHYGGRGADRFALPLVREAARRRLQPVRLPTRGKHMPQNRTSGNEMLQPVLSPDSVFLWKQRFLPTSRGKFMPESGKDMV